ncbi:FAD/NAD(P)-binding domain-containing protein [Aaosphaeria arxii CBS 175.79]|uniref:FAD/NAD(P)-binding domain-containing protein n=1 Tax=Aaosphaeria arxii CBS 175.79 TaxID=1450172 RepID=A0A6A5X651_9PLEO|nr:FAD/NAD(P)-binding domain-containing protein [Aaosphaeria arxii CBS 175.79]KAF2008458.1 FAD/NAD(P)-binding domain-containing protein [Aaosphaeria arxii CBS 175.79]
MGLFKLLQHLITSPILFFYQVIQWFLDKLLSPAPPPPNPNLVRPKIAVIGAGITGVSAASHIVGHGFDCRIFEAGPKKNLGGIWSKVNNTSGLQIHSLMYRFHPSVKWDKGYPDRKQIVSQVTELWKRYGLEDKTSFNTPVEKVYRDPHGRWVINDTSNGRFDGVIAAIGTCGDPKMPKLPGQEHFKGEIHHSSQLDGVSAKGKKVVVIGGGASAVEALEFVAREEAEHTNVLARSEKWIIPRNPFIDVLLALNIFGSETIFSWIPENILRLFFYRDLYDISPPRNSGKGIFTETPMVNDNVLDLVRTGKASWLRGDTLGYDKSGKGVRFNKRAQGVPKNGPGEEQSIEADMVIMATGYERPSLKFLPDEVFEEPYDPPNWYLQVFPPDHPEICCNNCTYVNAIGTVGNYHIGIYTRFLLMYLVDPLARPRTRLMKLWIDMTRWIKSKAPGGAFDFFTYSELIYWFVFTIAINPFRWKWAPFVLFGIGKDLPLKVVQREDQVRDGMGVEKTKTRIAGHQDEGLWMANGRRRGKK